MRKNFIIFLLLKSPKAGVAHRRHNKFVHLFFLFIYSFFLFAFSPGAITLAENGEAKVSIQIPPNPTETQQFAALELAKYLRQISGAAFSTSSDAQKNKPVIKLKRENGDPKDAYDILIRKNNIILSGNSDRAILFAVYDFLNQFGCLWLAPDFDLYEGHAEIIPRRAVLIYSSPSNIRRQPAFTYRKIDIDAGRTHNTENLKKMIDWMPKVRYNTLRVPLNLNGNGNVQWDKWRDDLTPELKKRDILLEIGGHGYQNFLNAKMDSGRLFQNHPDWFAKDSQCRLSASERLVFNTSNRDAVNYFIKNVIQYVEQHPEINILGIWPPDIGRWADCKEFDALGTPENRHADLTNKVAEAIYKVRPDIMVEIIAYSHTLLPPQKTILNKRIFVDFCPINQNFEKQIYDVSSQNNFEYANAIRKWKQSFSGDVGIYSYYRKYAWRSAPNVMPRYIQKDMQWYAKMKMRGISTYAEPGDWFTYELNHFILAQVAWNPNTDINALCDEFYKARYQNSWLTAKSAYESIEEISAVYGSTPFTSLKQVSEINAAKTRIEDHIVEARTAIGKEESAFARRNFSKLTLMLQYLQKDLGIQENRAKEVDNSVLLSQIKDILAFLEKNIDAGVFILTKQNDLSRFTKKYGLTNQSLLD